MRECVPRRIRAAWNMCASWRCDGSRDVNLQLAMNALSRLECRIARLLLAVGCRSRFSCRDGSKLRMLTGGVVIIPDVGDAHHAALVCVAAPCKIHVRSDDSLFVAMRRIYICVVLLAY